MQKTSNTPGAGTRCSSGTSEVRPAHKLAELASKSIGANEPVVNLFRLARRWNATLRAAPGARDLGRLEVDGRRAIIHFRTDAGNARQRFTIAHELGHLLLLRVERVGLRDQHADRRFEKYCNAFASHLLVPRPWVADRYSDAEPALETAEALARRAQCSTSAAIAGLNDSLDGWSAVFVIWTRASFDRSSWYPLSFFGPRDCRFRLEASAETSRTLSELADLGQNLVETVVPVGVDGEIRQWPTTARIKQGRIATYSPTPSAVLPELPTDFTKGPFPGTAPPLTNE